MGNAKFYSWAPKSCKIMNTFQGFPSSFFYFLTSKSQNQIIYLNNEVDSFIADGDNRKIRYPLVEIFLK